MTPLGWTLDARLPDGVISHRFQDLALISAEAATPRDMLDWHQRLASSGVDLLPLSPARPCSLAEALALTGAEAPTLLAQLRTLRGQVQVTAHFTWTEPMTEPQPEAASGRAWLEARRQRLARATEACDWLTRFARSLALPATPVEQRPSAALLHLLVPRDRPMTPQTLPDLPGPAGCLTLIGPWPPLAFTQPLPVAA